MGAMGAEAVQAFRELMPEVPELSTAGPKGGTDGNTQVMRSGAIYTFHFHDGPGDNTIHASTPSAVNGPHCFYDRIVQ
ncbi:MAG: hypothetical protein Kow0089_12000 [Desulfobulbaceae bacterium]